MEQENWWQKFCHHMWCFRKHSAALLPNVSEAFLSHNEGKSIPAMKSILCVATRCPRGSRIPYTSEEQTRCAVYPLFCSLLSQRQSCPIQEQGASVYSGPRIAGPGTQRSLVSFKMDSQWAVKCTLYLVKPCKNQSVQNKKENNEL